ncbi:MAG: fibronectin type III domain-containing protein [Deltaproteobacteria bacterium]|nr:fibronectin type III domain-containing protein [Deltaproteobacteria bacterium]
MIRGFWGVVACVFVLISSNAYGAGVTLAWDAPEGETPVTGYRIYYGTTPESQPTKVEAGKPSPLQTTVGQLAENQTYYFVVRAYNDAGESPDSNKITWSYTDTTPPLPPVGVSVQ